MIKLIAVFLLLFSGSVFADDYAMVANTTYSGYPSPDAYCQANYGSARPASIMRTSDYGCYLPPDGPVYQGSSFGYTSYTCPGGGYPDHANRMCLNAISCVAPAVRGADGICAEPFLCPPVDTVADISVLQATDNSALNPPESGLTITISDYADSKNYAVSGGATYSFTPSDFAGGCFKAVGSADIYCDYHAKATGECSESATNNAHPTPANHGDAVSVKGDAGCVSDAAGNTVCSSNPDGDKKCGTVNGVEICIDTTPGTGSINGKPYQVSDKNCGYVNGKPVCASNDGQSATNQGCVQNGGVRQCVNSDVKSTSSSNTTANPDGTTTTSNTSSSNIIGKPDGTSTTVTDADGNSSTTTTGSGSGDSKVGENDVNCDRYPNSLGCQDVSGGAAFVPDSNLVHSTVDVGFTPVSGFGSSGSCPSPISFSAFGKPYSISWDMVCSFSTQMRPIILIVSTLAALVIIFSVA